MTHSRFRHVLATTAVALTACSPKAAFQERAGRAPEPLRLSCTAPETPAAASRGLVALSVTDARAERSPGNLYDARRRTAPIPLAFDTTATPAAALAADVTRILAARGATASAAGTKGIPQLAVELREISTDARSGTTRATVTGRVRLAASLRSADGIGVWSGDVVGADSVRAVYVSGSTHQSAIGAAYCRALSTLGDSVLAPAARGAGAR